MSIGIYCMYWEIDDSKVYIGQSNNIARRYGEHISTLKNNTHRNYKIQRMFNEYGYPLHTILEECTVLCLDQKEQEWIKEYDALNSGYNLNPGGFNHSQGVNNPNSLYSEEVLETAFLLLSNSTNTIKQISESTGVRVGILKCISSGTHHTWLAAKYPKEWDKLLSRRRVVKNTRTTGISLGVKLHNTLTGITYTLDTSISEFAITHGLYPSHLSSIIRKERKSHKGFVLSEAT